MLHAAHVLSSHHAKEIRQSAKCGCFYCETAFPPALISEWTDEADTALCPFCGIDAVIAEGSGLTVSAKFLSAMHKFWFADQVDLETETPEDWNEDFA